MKKIILISLGFFLIIISSFFALNISGNRMDGVIYTFIMISPLDFFQIGWRLIVVPLTLIIGIRLIIDNIFSKNWYVPLLIFWVISYSGYMAFLYNSKSILLLQNFHFNIFQDFLFLFLMCLLISVSIPIIFDYQKRYDIIVLSICFLSLNLISVGGWWTGPESFELGTKMQALEFSCSIPIFTLLYLSLFGIIKNVIVNLLKERSVWDYA